MNVRVHGFFKDEETGEEFAFLECLSCGHKWEAEFPFTPPGCECPSCLKRKTEKRKPAKVIPIGRARRGR